jgi:alkanesulfonate monooxygenase SsuD/methylene tetrahydromethanopterin reductase-like flavin-dependent oxidoreductase (luciferase family)
VKLGVMLPIFSGDPAKVVSAARESEALGYEGVFAFDHFFPPGAPRDRPSLEAFSSLAAVAAATKRIALGTLVSRVSLRPAGLLAKTASWLDAASGGRLILGVGTGDPIDWPEHDAYGLPRKRRRERREELEETIAALKALFEGRPFPGGRHVPALEGPLLPPPERPGGPPIWVGAQADEADAFGAKVELHREAAGGRPVEASWAGIVLTGADEAETRELLERRRTRGLDDEAWVGTVDELAALLRALAAAGAAWAVMVLAGPADRRALVAERVLAALAAAPRPS